ncbi:type I phosphomannose isomerase catalytic subunit [Mediterraneibacter glycyrrhizinilyticus]|uniref:type I phosphomannose isomerase catalytic subunit n=1 Tax=Mediterraneibacter glycyrrhizinilyticus TaxID=342942 RepID=UPI002ED161AF
MSVLKLIPACKDYLWGGHRLVDEYNKEYDGDILAETWELSCHPDGPSRIANGRYAGKTLAEYIEGEGKGVLGSHCRRFRDFPILIKFIDAKQDLSVQVHPDNRYALKNEGQYGKTEMWYVVDAGEDATLYYGFKQEISKEEFAERIQNDTVLDVLNKVPVQKGDVLFIESGTIHAIGADILIAEIQQNSNVTYRVYDYGRVGKDGKKRDLHIEKALAVTDRVPLIKTKKSYPHVADCDYFTVDKLNLDGKMMRRMEGRVSDESFVSILILDGEGTVSCVGDCDREGETDGTQRVSYRKGDSLFLPAGSGEYVIEGSCDALITTIRDKAAPVRIGIDIGGTDTKIGLVDAHQKIIDTLTVSTKIGRPAEEIIADIGKGALELLEKNQIPVEQCTGVGIGVPGTVDRKNGTVVYANNMQWENVPLIQEIGQYLPLPVEIANDADCAVLGEMYAGAAKGYSNVVMLTLGTGVGGGVVLDGRLFDGRLAGGSELGHMVVCAGGEQCTCGRKGCLEAYASATALVRDAKRAMKKDEESLLWKLCGSDAGQMTAKMVFDAAEQGDASAAHVIDSYVEHLSTGIVNIVNIFRPEVFLLGGGVAGQGKKLTDRINRNLAKYCYAGNRGGIPEVRTAELGNRAGMIGAANLL